MGAERAFVALRLRGLSVLGAGHGEGDGSAHHTRARCGTQHGRLVPCRLCALALLHHVWDSKTHKAVILLPQAEHLAMTAPGSPWVAVLFRTDSWATVAHTKLVSVPRFAPVAAPTLAPVPAAPLLGRCVRLVGLVGRPELNGEIAHAVLFDPPSSRYTVRLANGAATVAALSLYVRQTSLRRATSTSKTEFQAAHMMMIFLVFG